MLLLAMLACRGDPLAPLVWPVPDELPPLPAVAGDPRTLDAYVRPGLGRGHPLQARPSGSTGRWWPEDPTLFDSGALTVLWIASHDGEVSTWAGHDAPWRDDGCADGCYAVDAPVRALHALALDLDVPSPPALLAMGRDASVGTVADLVGALDEVGVAAHAVVSPDGRAPVAGTAVPTVHVVELVPSAPVDCTVAFHPLQTWSDVLESASTCPALGLRPLAPEPQVPARERRADRLRSLDVAMAQRPTAADAPPLHVCSVTLGGIAADDGVPVNAVRPVLSSRRSTWSREMQASPELEDVARCAQAGPAHGDVHVTLALEAGRPSRVDAVAAARAVAPPQVLTCVRDHAWDWRFSAEATGRVEVELEVACAPPG